MHATCVAIDGHGVLLRGPSGSGKSDLALRLIAQDAALVADDQVALAADDDELWATAPERLRGLMEVRGVGLVRLPVAGRAPVRLVVDLVPPDEVPRLPERQTCDVAGVTLPCYRLHALQASAPAKLRLLLRACHEPLIVEP